MGNPLPSDRRFDKPPLDSLVDLLNKSNKTYLVYGTIAADRVQPVASDTPELYNSSVRICLPGMEAVGPYSRMTYARLDIGEYVPVPDFFNYVEGDQIGSLFTQLREKHRIWLTGEDCAVVIGDHDENSLRTITFVPKDGHLVWTGVLKVQAGALNHIGKEIRHTEMLGFTIEQLTA